MIKQVIRENLPETNSSSSHSVAISLDPKGIIGVGDAEWDLIIDDQGNLHIPNFQSFGRNFFYTNSALTKLQYLSCHYLYGPYINRGTISKELTKFRSVIKDILGININKVVIDDFVSFWKEVKEGIIEKDDQPYYEYPEVDHESLDIFEEILETEETIKNFILNKNTWIYGGDDGFRGDPHLYIDTEILPTIIGCFSIDFGGDIGRVDVEIDENMSQENLEQQLRFFNNFKYYPLCAETNQGVWGISDPSSCSGSIYFGPTDSLVLMWDDGKLYYNTESAQIEINFELYDFGSLAI